MGGAIELSVLVRRGALPVTAPKFGAAAGRNAAFMRQGRPATPDCRMNAAFRGQCPEEPCGGAMLTVEEMGTPGEGHPAYKRVVLWGM